MRYLNKIVFINSASVQYAEIELDGNVHLTGTQGVGKSTLLRAILFFYNANKSKLGIPAAKKRFDDYYFEFQNSYIIYEVIRDGSPYSVVVYKVHGKAAYRFIDAGFQREFFIDEAGRARESWEKIRSVLGRRVHYSRIVTAYADYRRIIYGDNRGLKPEFRRYSLLESRQYQNIPRTIQNVLLNSNLEAQFIKDTIINSISEDEFTIDLSNYAKSHLRDFETEIRDIRMWSQKNKKGRIVIRDRADRVIENHRVYTFLQREKADLARQLAARITYITRKKPSLLSDLFRETEHLTKLQKEREHLKQLHRKREQKLISHIDFLKNRLREAKKRQDEYAGQQIHRIIEKVAREESLLREEKALREEKMLLTSQFAGIHQKYDALISQIENQQKAFENEKHREINRAEKEFTAQKMKFMESCREIIAKIQAAQEDEKTQVENDLQVIAEQENSIQRRKAELKYKEFFHEEIAQAETAGREIEKHIFTARSQIKTTQKETATLRKEWNLEKERVEERAAREIESQQERIDQYRGEIRRIEEHLAAGRDSLYGWLNDRIPRWEETIGKVIDRDVLFRTNLCPEKSDNSQSLYGVTLNLNALETSVPTVEEYKAEITALNENIAAAAAARETGQHRKDDRLQSLKRKFGKKINTCRETLSLNEYRLSQSEEELKLHRVTLDELKDRAEKEKQAASQRYEAELEKLSPQKQAARKALEKITASVRRRIRHAERERDRDIARAESAQEETETTLRQTIDTQRGESNTRIRELREHKRSELAHTGADTRRLESIEQSLSTISDALVFIKNNRSLVSDYHKDKRELFDRIPQFKAEISAAEKKHSSLQEEQKTEDNKLLRKLADQENAVSQLTSSVEEFDHDLDAWETFKKSDVCETIHRNMPDSEEQKTRDVSTISARDLMDKIKDKYFGSIAKYKDLQQSINLFAGEFSEQNVFRFAVKFNTDHDYFTFAEELKEFIEEDKIREFEARVNERFAHIIHLIGTETAELISKEAEIGKIIKKINADFVNKNFVEAIKHMEMRMQESSNPVVRLLVKIKDFSEENMLELGEHNLFSSSDQGEKNRQAVDLLRQLVKELDRCKNQYLTLSESFDLQFRIVENDNDSGWVEKLSNVGSEGTDILVKAMVNILLLNVFKENASKKFRDFKLHCMMDEIGRLHPANVKGILRFANERNILLINGSPTSQNAMDYKYTYRLSKVQSSRDNTKYITRITRLIKVAQQAKR
jgi:hypothetical protein